MIVQPSESTYLHLSSKHLAAMNLRGDTRLTNLRNANQMKEYLRSEDDILGGLRELTMKHRKLLQILEILRVFLRGSVFCYCNMRIWRDLLPYSLSAMRINWVTILVAPNLKCRDSMASTEIEFRHSWMSPETRGRRKVSVGTGDDQQHGHSADQCKIEGRGRSHSLSKVSLPYLADAKSAAMLRSVQQCFY